MEATLNSMSIAAIIIFNITALVNGFLDGKSIKIGDYIDSRGHNIRLLWRSIFIILSCYSIFYSFPEQNIDLDYIKKSIFYCIIMSSSFWITFELSINYFMGKKLLRIGKTATLDKIATVIFFNSGFAYLLFKIGLLTIGIYYFNSL